MYLDSDSSKTSRSNNGNKKVPIGGNDIKARYWAYLFDNLKRSIDEIYHTCEHDENINQCKEVVLTLEKCTNEFKILIKHFQESQDFKTSTKKRFNTNTSHLWDTQKTLASNNKKSLVLKSKINEKDDFDLNELNLKSSSSNGFNLELLNDKIQSTFAHDDNDDIFSEGAQNFAISKNSLSSFKLIFPANDRFITKSIFGNQDKELNKNTFCSNSDNDIKMNDFDLYTIHDENKMLFEEELYKQNYTFESEENDLLNDEYDYEEDIDLLRYNLKNENSNSQSTSDFDNKNSSSSSSSNKIIVNKHLNIDNMNIDRIDEVMLKVYEEEENLTLALEQAQDKELRSVIAQEFKLTKQLSVEKLKQYNTDTDLNDTEIEEFDLLRRKNSWKKYRDDEIGSNRIQFDVESDTDRRRTYRRTSQVHEKLSSLSRKTSPSESRRKHEEKQARAQEKREQFYEERAQKLRELTKKIEQVCKLKNDLIRAKKLTMKVKLERAEEKRLYLLQMKAKKAADEEQKAHEILFINNLKEQNRKQDILERYEKKHEAIRHNLEEERIRKQEEQKAKEAAAVLRRKELEAQRVAKLKELQEKRRLKQTKIAQILSDKEKDRIESAKAKERNREQRLATLEAQLQANKEEVKKRIIQKHEEWGKRHESNLEEIRKKAFEMSILHFSVDDHHSETSNSTPYEKAKFCSICNVIINSDSHLQSHLRSIRHQQYLNESNQGRQLTKSEIEEYNMQCLVELPTRRDSSLSEEKKETTKKRMKKLKSRLTQRGNLYEATCDQDRKLKQNDKTLHSANALKLQKHVKELSKISQSNDKGPWAQKKVTQLDRTLKEICRTLDKNNEEQSIFGNIDGLSICVNLLEFMSNASSSQSIPSKTISNLVNLVYVACKNHYENCYFMLFSNKLTTVLELLHTNLKIMIPEGGDRQNKLIYNIIATSLAQLVTEVFTCLYDKRNDEKNDKDKDNSVFNRANDTINLILSFGLLDKLSALFSVVKGPLNDDLKCGEMIIELMNFLISIIKFLSVKKSNAFVETKFDDTTQFILKFRTTNCLGVLSMIYAMLHKDSSPIVKSDQLNANTIKRLSPITCQIATICLKMLNQIAILDLNMYQQLLGEEYSALQFRNISSFFLMYCGQIKSEDLLHEIILAIGYFTVLNQDNQTKLELGTPPTILQLLCTLPFNYFSDKKLVNVLHPTLICCCYENEKNKSVLATEVSCILLANYIKEKMIDENVDDSNIQRFEFDKRFPKKLWTNVYEYFSTITTKSMKKKLLSQA